MLESISSPKISMNSKQLLITCLLACVAVASARSFIAQKMYQKFRDQHEQHSESETVWATSLDTSFLETGACPQSLCCSGSGKFGSMKCPHAGGVCCAGSDFCCPANHKCAAKADGMHCLKPLAGAGALGGEGSEGSDVSESAVLNAFENSLSESSIPSVGALPSSGGLSGSLAAAANARIPIPASTLAGVPGLPRGSESSMKGSLGPASPPSLGSSIPPAPGSAAAVAAAADSEDSKPQTINIVSHIILQTHKKKGGGIEVTAVPAK